ncbi:hypothetical protein STEG23_001508 [Scotinomys teguina]
MQSGGATNNGGRTIEVKTTAPHCQLLLIVLMAVMLLPGVKGSSLLVREKNCQDHQVTRKHRQSCLLALGTMLTGDSGRSVPSVILYPSEVFDVVDD